MSDLDDLTARIQTQLSIPYDRARKIAIANLPTIPVESPETARHGQNGARETVGTPSRPVSEQEEQRRIRRDAIASGGKVYWLSQARKTGQTPGLPDLWIAFPTLGMWWETKALDGSLSPFQLDFAAECQQNGTAHGSGTHADWLAWCASRGLTITPL